MTKLCHRFVFIGTVLAGSLAMGQIPDHPILTEIFNNPKGDSDAPVGRDPTNPHQEFIEFYLPPGAQLNAGLNKDALNITIYAVEGDLSSSGYTLVNYRIDLPTFDLDPSNGLTMNAVARPPSGIVVVGWVDYVYSDAGTCKGDGAPCSIAAQDCADLTQCRGTPTDLLGTPSTRVGLVNGGITGATDYLFVALNGAQFSGTTNFPVPVAISSVDLPGEANSGIMQNGSEVYMLVNRDDPGYVERYDDKDPAHQPPIPNADLSLAAGNVLLVSSLLDGVAVNDHFNFDVLLQPYPFGDSVDLANVLPQGGAYSLLIPQVAEDVGNGYIRLFGDVPKTTEDGIGGNEDPAADAVNAYRITSEAGPWFAGPGRATFTFSPPELAVADVSLQVVDVLAETTGSASLLAANVGGNFGMIVTTAPGASSDPTAATFAPGDAVIVLTGQTEVFPKVAATVTPSGIDGALVSAPVVVQGSNLDVGDPPVVNPTWNTTVTVRVLNPTTGLDVNGLPFETTVFVAVQGIPADPVVANELLNTDLGAFLAAQPDITALDTFGNGSTLIDPSTDLSNRLIVRPLVKELPADGEECLQWLPRPSAPIPPGFADTVVTSAEVLSGATTYDSSIGICASTGQTVIRGIRVNVPDTLTFGGSFTPSEPVTFVGPNGAVGDPQSSLTNVTTSRTFEVALIDTAVQFGGSLETGASDDFGLIVEVKATEAGAPVSSGDYIFLSYTGGRQGADIDSLNVPPGNNVATIVLLDLDNLHDVLGIRSIEALYVIDAGAGGEVDIMDGFSLNLEPTPCVRDSECDDGLFCNGAETCVSGFCQTSPPVDCDDGVNCTVDSCNDVTNACDHVAADALCDNGLFCDGTETCNASLGCEPGPLPCPGQGCNEATDTCEPTNCFVSTPAVPQTGFNINRTVVPGIKNRYLSFRAGDPGKQQAIRVTFVALPGAFSAFNGSVMWVGPVRHVSTKPGKGFNCGEDPGCTVPLSPCCVGSDTFFSVAPLQCSPFFRDWTTASLGSEDGFVHVQHVNVIPGGSYSIQVVEASCDVNVEASFSAPLVLNTSRRWADVCGPITAAPACVCCASPDPLNPDTDTVNDVLGVLDAFGEETLTKIQADLQGIDQATGLPSPILNGTIDVGEIAATQDEFSNAQGYPFFPGPPPCAAGRPTLGWGRALDPKNRPQ